MVIKRLCVYTLTYDTEVMFQLQCKLCCLQAGFSKRRGVHQNRRTETDPSSTYCSCAQSVCASWQNGLVKTVLQLSPARTHTNDGLVLYGVPAWVRDGTDTVGRLTGQSVGQCMCSRRPRQCGARSGSPQLCKCHDKIMYLRIVRSKCSAVKTNVKLAAYIIMFLLSSTYCSCAQSVCVPPGEKWSGQDGPMRIVHTVKTMY